MSASLLLLVAALNAAQTRPTSADVERYLTAARNLHDGLEYERSLEQLERAKRISRGLVDDVAIALYQGVVFAELGRGEEERLAFETALSLDPDAPLPVRVSPKVSEAFEKIRAAVKKKGPQGSVTSAPHPATPGSAAVAAPTARSQAAGPGSGPAVWVPAVAGGVLMGAGAVSLGLAYATDGRIRAGDPSLQTEAQLGQALNTERTLGVAAVAFAVAGGAALAVAGGLWLWRGEVARPTVAFVAGPQGAAVGVKGVF